MLAQSELSVAVDGAVLAGTLWKPAEQARSVVLMIPGSGPASRTCDGYFSPIIEHLSDSGHAVAAFDKRGAGESTGSFAQTEIATQAEDAQRCLDLLAEETGDLAVGLFGHSQGGWVTFEVALQRPELAFAISNSGPAVGPAAQERALLLGHANAAIGQSEANAYDQVVASVRRGDPTQAVIDQIMQIRSFRERINALPKSETVEWELEMSFMRYEPAVAIRDLKVPTLVVHGEHDELIPVHDSFAELDRIANPAIRTVLLPEANHRLLDSNRQDLVDGYLDVVTDFVERVLETL